MQGQDQLRQRVAFALSQIMVISAFKIGDPTAFSLWNNMMQKDAFGNFSTLLNDVTLSPSMGYYLDGEQQWLQRLFAERKLRS